MTTALIAIGTAAMAYGLGVWATRQKFIPALNTAYNALRCVQQDRYSTPHTRAAVDDADEFVEDVCA